jgi:hypothetical protein
MFRNGISVSKIYAYKIFGDSEKFPFQKAMPSSTPTYTKYKRDHFFTMHGLLKIFHNLKFYQSDVQKDGIPL